MGGSGRRHVRRAAVAVALAVLAGGPAAGAASLRDLLERITFVTPPEFGAVPPRNNFGRPIAAALGSTVARAMPTIAASAGLRYTLDPTTLVFVRETQVNGQVLLESPEPIGRGKWTVSVAYARLDLETFEGHHLSTLRDDHSFLLGVATAPQLDLGVTSDQLAFGATVGVTDDLELNLTVPVLHTSLSAATRRVRLPPDGVGNFRAVDVHVSASRVGVGDVLLRGKYRLLRGAFGTAAAGLVLRFPSGDADDFQGTGDVELSPLLYASTPRWTPIDPIGVRGYLNGGVDVVVADAGDSQGRWGVGLDIGLGSTATLGVSVAGRHAFRRIAPEGFFDVPRLDATDGSVVSAPLFGFEGDRPDYYDLAVGGRVILWRDVLIAFAHAIVPLNRAGFRAEVIPIAGIEAAF